eukprot:10432286-Alexandrium_andersonii.AAC.1
MRCLRTWLRPNIAEKEVRQSTALRFAVQLWAAVSRRAGRWAARRGYIGGPRRALLGLVRASSCLLYTSPSPRD